MTGCPIVVAAPIAAVLLVACASASPPPGKVVATVAIGTTSTTTTSSSANSNAASTPFTGTTSFGAAPPTASAVPKSTIPPTSTSTPPTPTLIPPTPTSIPPTPTPIPNTTRGSTLAFDQTWFQPDIRMTLSSFQFGESSNAFCGWSFASFHLLLENTSSGNLLPTVDTRQWQVFDDRGKTFVIQKDGGGCNPDPLVETPAMKAGATYDRQLWLDGRLTDVSRSSMLHIRVQHVANAIPSADWQISVPH